MMIKVQCALLELLALFMLKQNIYSFYCVFLLTEYNGHFTSQLNLWIPISMVSFFTFLF
jgi:hypothetical protein